MTAYAGVARLVFFSRRVSAFLVNLPTVGGLSGKGSHPGLNSKPRCGDRKPAAKPVVCRL